MSCDTSTEVKLDYKSCEVLETVLSHLKMSTLDLESTNLDDEVSPLGEC